MAMLGNSSRSSISSHPVPESTMTDMVPRYALSSRRGTSVAEENWTATDALMFDEEETRPLHSQWETAVIHKPRDANFHGVDRLVQDLLAARTRLEEEKKKAAEKDAEIAHLREKVAQLSDEAHDHRQKSSTAVAKTQQIERFTALQPALDEEVDELRRLLAFHKTNGERVSRQCQDLQAANKDLQVSLQATEKVIGEQKTLISGLLGVQPSCGKWVPPHLRGRK